MSSADSLYSILAESPVPVIQRKIPVEKIPLQVTSIRYYASLMIRKNGKHLSLSKSDWDLLEKFIFPEIGDLSIQVLYENPAILSMLLHKIEKDCDLKTAGKAFRILHLLCQAMTADFLIPFNLSQDAYSPAHVRSAPFSFTSEERHQILMARYSDIRFSPISLCLITGLTPEEICLLRKKDYRKEVSSLYVTSPASSTRYSRTIPLSETARRIINQYMRNVSYPSPDTQLFIRPSGHRQTVNTLRASLNVLRKASGISSLSFANFKRNFIVTALSNNVDPVQIKEFLGLKKPGIILAYQDKLLM